MKIKKTICLFIALILIGFSFISCKSTEEIIKDTEINNKTEISDEILREDMEFVKKIKNILSAGHGRWEYYKDLDEFINTGINFIIRGQVIAREESAITMFGIPLYPNDDLRSENYEYARNARSRIATPYKIQINEVYHGDINKKDDIITIYALYGIVDGFKNRIFDDAPIYNVGAEYILFLDVEEQYENIVYIPPMNLLKLDTTNGVFESEGLFGNIYSKYENDTNKFVTDLKELIKNNNYNTEVKVIGSKEELQKVIDQRNKERAADGLDIFIPDVLNRAETDNKANDDNENPPKETVLTEDLDVETPAETSFPDDKVEDNIETEADEIIEE